MDDIVLPIERSFRLVMHPFCASSRCWGALRKGKLRRKCVEAFELKRERVEAVTQALGQFQQPTTVTLDQYPNEGLGDS